MAPVPEAGAREPVGGASKRFDVGKVGLALLLPVLLVACGAGTGRGLPAEADAVVPDGTGQDWFVDRAAASGLDFEHFNGMTGEWYDAEIFGGGVALVDYDNDGDLDAYLVQGGMLDPDRAPAEALFPPRTLPPGDTLFRNELEVAPDGSRVLRFTDVTAASGIEAWGYGMGVSTGDIDNDGWVDLYVTNLGPNQLLRNNGDGSFSDITEQSGTGDPGWGVSASFVDVDRDGWLDLYVGNYLTYSVAADVDCFAETGALGYCSPVAYRAQPDRLYRNNADGTFADVTAQALTGGQYGPALGVVSGDFDGDGWPDIYVANDGEENLLWVNQGDGTFVDQALLSGSALNSAGRPEASMGVDAGDLDNDGDDDLFMTHWVGEKNTLYVQTSPGLFEDRSAAAGLVGPSLPLTGFGAGWFDADNDGWLDLLVVNGAVLVKEELAGTDPLPLREPNQLFRNLADGRFEDVTGRAGAAFERPEVSRGAAFGDVDNDGDVDVLVGNNSGPARLLVNTQPAGHHWLGLRLVGEDAARDMLGARLGVVRSDGSVLWRRVHADGSYASARDPRVIVGLGTSEVPVGVRVRWPGGEEEAWSEVAVDRWVTLQQGGGQ